MSFFMLAPPPMHGVFRGSTAAQIARSHGSKLLRIRALRLVALYAGELAINLK
jgi:hypothetical protein